MQQAARSGAIAIVVQQHADECAILRNTRSYVVRAADVSLKDLKRHDERLAAHLDGLALAGELGVRLAKAALERPGTGEFFTMAVRTLEDKRLDDLDRLLALTESVPIGESGLLSAFGWVSASDLRGTAKTLLESESPYRRLVGLAACGLHSVDPGEALNAGLVDPDPRIRARAVRLAGECARADLSTGCLRMLRDENPLCRFLAARSSLMLGNRGAALEALEHMALAPNEFRAQAATLLVKAVPMPRAHAVLTALARDPSALRTLLQSIAAAGDPRYVAWLIARMREPLHARLAGEAFTFITGVDLSENHLDANAPDELELVPTGDPERDDVHMDEDESLAWPNAAKVAAWWTRHGAAFTPGTRYFAGRPPSIEHCVSVLSNGRQRLRIAAAEHLCLLRPATILFNVAAPGWRQERLITQGRV